MVEPRRRGDSQIALGQSRSMNTVSLSFLTPTYNRAHTLPRVWESLNRQKRKDFEWVVVDDGSEDETPALIEGWAAEAPFLIIYHRKENGGKNSAINVGKTLVSGDYTVIIDSDDALLDDAVEVIDKYLVATGIADIPEVGGLSFLCTDADGKTLGQELPFETLRCTISDAYYRHRIRGELTGLIKTEILKRLEFPELPPPEHVPESVAYIQLSRSYDFIYVNRPIRRYYLNDGEKRLTDKADGGARGVKWPHGKYLRRRSILNDEVGWFLEDPAFFVRNAVNMNRFGLHIGRSPRAQFAELSNLPAKLLWIVGLVPGVFKYLRDRRRYPSSAPPSALRLQ